MDMMISLHVSNITVYKVLQPHKRATHYPVDPPSLTDTHTLATAPLGVLNHGVCHQELPVLVREQRYEIAQRVSIPDDKDIHQDEERP